MKQRMINSCYNKNLICHINVILYNLSTTLSKTHKTMIINLLYNSPTLHKIATDL